MKVDIIIDADFGEPEVTIRTAAITDDVQRAAAILTDTVAPAQLVGFSEGSAHLLDPACVRRIYASGGKVHAVSNQGVEYVLKLRLYEAEKRLAAHGFIRISHSEIVNLQDVEKFDLSLSGTILIVLADGSTAYVSRRYVPRIREVLGM